MAPSPSDTTTFAAQLRRQIARMEQLADRAESDGEYEACRQVLIGLKAQLQSADRGRA